MREPTVDSMLTMAKAAMIKDGFDYKTIANVFNVGVGNIRTTAHAHGLCSRRNGKIPKDKTQYILDRYSRGHTAIVIAKEFGVTSSAIGMLARKHGVKSGYIRPTLGPRDCSSCKSPLPKKHKGHRCKTCDRRHCRNGSCACGYAYFRAFKFCPACGKSINPYVKQIKVH